MSMKIDQASAVESRRAQMTGTSTSTAAPTSSSKISMFGAKSGFVIPKNKLSGSLVPIFRGGKKLGASDGANEENTKSVQRKTKWRPDLTQDAAVRRGRALAYQTRVDQITLQLKAGVLEIGDNQDSSLVAQVADQESSSHQTNSEKSELLELERREAIGEILKLNPSYKAPPDYKPLLKEARVPIPVKEYPGYNFIGLIFGPGSDTLKRLEKEIGAKVQVYGTKADTREKIEITPSDGNESQGAFEELYLHISADNFEKVDAAVGLIELLVTPVSGNAAVVSTAPTSVSGDNASVLNQSQEVVPTSGVNLGAVLPQVSGPLQTPQGQFQYPGPWFPIGPPAIPTHQPSGFIPPPNSAQPILNNPPQLPSLSFSASNLPSLFGPRPSPAAGFVSVPQNPSPVPLRPPSSAQILQRPYMPLASPLGHAGPLGNPPMMAQQPLAAQTNVSTPLPFTGNQPAPPRPATGRPSTPLLPQPLPNLLPSDRPMTPAGWPGPPVGNPSSLGPSQMVQMAPSMVPPRGPRPVVPQSAVASVAPPPSNIPVNFPPRPSAPQLPNTPQNRPVATPGFASVPSYQMGPSPTTQLPLPPAPIRVPVPPNPSPSPVLVSAPVPPPTPPLQFGIPSPVSGGIPGFTPVRSPVTTPIPQRPSSGDFTFRPLNPASQTVAMPALQNTLPPKPMVQPPVAPSFRVAMHNSTPQPTMPSCPRPGPVLSATVPFVGNLSPMSAPPRPPSFQSPTIPVPQSGPPPGNFNPVRQISNLPGPYPPRAGPPPRPGNQHYPFGASGGQQIYDPFLPTSATQGGGGGNPAQFRKEENESEYEDLMASVGVK